MFSRILIGERNYCTKWLLFSCSHIRRPGVCLPCLSTFLCKIVQSTQQIQYHKLQVTSLKVFRAGGILLPRRQAPVGVCLFVLFCLVQIRRLKHPQYTSNSLYLVKSCQANSRQDNNNKTQIGEQKNMPIGGSGFDAPPNSQNEIWKKRMEVVWRIKMLSNHLLGQRL